MQTGRWAIGSLMSGDAAVLGDESAVFEAAVGHTVPASRLAPNDYLIDPRRFASEGNWAFCRFDSDDVPALRLGFQRGGFNGGLLAKEPSPAYLQLHLEVMTGEGALLWLPSGAYAADRLLTDSQTMDMHLADEGRELVRLIGWPTIECHFCSTEGDLEAHLEFALRTVTILPDCPLPHCLFAMWESMGDVSGTVRHRGERTSVRGKVFFDHTRVIPRRHSQTPRHRYVYSTVYFEDGSGLYGYHSVDATGRAIDSYCFVMHVDAAGQGRLAWDAALTRLVLDGDGIAKSWQISCRIPRGDLVVELRVRDSGILRSWGSPEPPRTRRDYSIIPLVLDGTATVAGAEPISLKAYGLAEYFDADLWPADKAASPMN